MRQHVDEYLGGYRFAGKRVLEIGPASGFLTFEMERRGADVVALEVPDDPGWDFVPYPDDVLQPIFASPREHMTRTKNSFWFLHNLNRSKAKLCYGDSCRIPNGLGTFDVALMASVLLHCERPLRIIAECAKRANTLIVTETYRPELEGLPICRLVPGPNNKMWDTWWSFSTDFIQQYFGVLGFRQTSIVRHEQLYDINGKTAPLFTAIGSKGELAERAKSSKETKDCSGKLPVGLLERCIVPRHDTLSEQGCSLLDVGAGPTVKQLAGSPETERRPAPAAARPNGKHPLCQQVVDRVVSIPALSRSLTG